MEHRGTVMKVFVTGASGMLGHMLCHTLEKNDIKFETSGKWNFLDTAQVDCFLNHLHKDDVVINCAGLIRQRLSKQPTPLEIRSSLILNGSLPHLLAERCYLVQISTDCVFSGKKGMYSEYDIPDPLDIYGKSKAAGEPQNALVLRQSIVGPEFRNYLGMFAWFMKAKKATGFAHHYWNGLTTQTLSECLVQILDEKLYTTKGIRHLFSNTLTKYEMCKIWNKYRTKPIEIECVLGYPVVDRTLTTHHPEFKEQFYIPPLDDQFKKMMI